MLMARTQTLVQLSDRLLGLLDQRAVARGVSRSQIIRQAIEEHLAEDLDAEISRAIIEGYRRTPQSVLDAWGDPAEQMTSSGRDVYRRLDAEERQAGHQPW
jgi:predicted transcriptional regulator